jgi:hypothetical protein
MSIEYVDAVPFDLVSWVISELVFAIISTVSCCAHHKSSTLGKESYTTRSAENVRQEPLGVAFFVEI